MNIPVLLAAMAAVIIFGGSAVATKVAVGGISPIDVSLLRTLIGGIIVLPLVAILNIPLPSGKEQRLLLLASGFCGFVAFPIAFTLGVSLTSANHATMILAALPIITGAMAMFWDRQKPAGLWWSGCIIAFAGEILLIYDSSGEASASVKGDLIVMLANFLASLGYVTGARLQRSGYSAKGTTFWGIILFALLLLPFSVFVIDFETAFNASSEVWLAVLYQAIGVTIIAYVLWYWALGTGGIARVGLFQFLQPVSGIILAGIILSDRVTPVFLVASIIILSGLILAFKAR
ncbi:MAG: drug/metabolite transporter (DMT)-like permease [Gammaproteobacteria bacterium]|jgi:drug/metabolite transporter (DMT)-like permease